MFFESWFGLLRVLVVGTLAYAALVFLLRLSGKRTLAKLNAFDLIVTVALGSTLATVLLNNSVALAEGVLAFALLAGLQYAVALSVRSTRFDALVKSEPSLLLHKGRFLDAALRAQRVTRDEVLSALRAAGVPGPEQALAVVLETDGTLSVLGSRPPGEEGDGAASSRPACCRGRQAGIDAGPPRPEAAGAMRGEKRMVHITADSRLSWLRLALATLAATVGGVGMWSVVVALPAVEAEFGISRAAASLPYTLTMVGFALGGVAFGRAVDRFGLARPLAVAGIALGLGYAGAAAAQNLWQFALAQGLLIGAASSIGFGPLMAEVSHWFRRHRATAIAVCAAGNYRPAPSGRR
ncbi:MFS transporter [Teichococcus aestuarii]|uniref:MFS transporter n=1 Tax=Teichococcus aestuarii TaxID=568898 RepID=UPI003620F607